MEQKLTLYFHLIVSIIGWCCETACTVELFQQTPQIIK